jgi:DNA-binding response OmpR family regulator
VSDRYVTGSSEPCVFLGAGLLLAVAHGWGVVRRAREIVSGIPVIYMSGDSVHEWSAHSVPESIMLQKPLVIAQLVTAITTLLNQASNAAALSVAMAESTSKKATD